MYKTERFELRLSARDAEILDQVRGSASRAAWLRAAIHAAAATTETYETVRLDVPHEPPPSTMVESVSTNVVGGNLSGPTKVGELTPPPRGPAPGGHLHEWRRVGKRTICHTCRAEK